MMKKKIDALIVVEGKTDVQFLSNFIDAEFITTNGSDVPRETIEYVQNAATKKQVIVLTDPDSPGKRIRDILNQKIPNLNHVYVDKKSCIKNQKVGIAESNQEYILEILSDFETRKKENDKFQPLQMIDLYNLGLMGHPQSQKIRNSVMKNFKIGYGNAKTLLKRFNALKISYEDIEKEVKKQL